MCLYINYTSHLWLESRRKWLPPQERGAPSFIQEQGREGDSGERERECKISMNQVHYTQVTQFYIPLQPKAKAPA